MDLPTYSYEGILDEARQSTFDLDTLLVARGGLDRRRPMLPDGVARLGHLPLGAEARLTLNHIRAHAHLGAGLLAHAIALPFILDHARPRVRGDRQRLRALLTLASEHAKHMELFARLRATVTETLELRCALAGNADALCRDVLSRHPIAIGFTVLVWQWGAERHNEAALAEREHIDPAFSRFFEQHWGEEARHAKLMTNIVEGFARTADASELRGAMDDLGTILALLDRTSNEQVELDIAALRRATGARLDPKTENTIRAALRCASRMSYLHAGLSHPRLIETANRVGPLTRARVDVLNDRYGG